MLYSEARTFGAWIGRIVKTYDYINHVVITLPLTVYEGTWTDTLPSRCYAITMILRVHRIFFEITTLPNKATFIILSFMSLLIHCISRYTAGGIHIESYFVLSIEL